MAPLVGPEGRQNIATASRPWFRKRECVEPRRGERPSPWISFAALRLISDKQFPRPVGRGYDLLPLRGFNWSIFSGADGVVNQFCGILLRLSSTYYWLRAIALAFAPLIPICAPAFPWSCPSNLRRHSPKCSRGLQPAFGSRIMLELSRTRTRAEARDYISANYLHRFL